MKRTLVILSLSFGLSPLGLQGFVPDSWHNPPSPTDNGLTISPWVAFDEESSTIHYNFYQEVGDDTQNSIDHDTYNPLFLYYRIRTDTSMITRTRRSRFAIFGTGVHDHTSEYDNGTSMSTLSSTGGGGFTPSYSGTYDAMIMDYFFDGPAGKYTILGTAVWGDTIVARKKTTQDWSFLHNDVSRFRQYAIASADDTIPAKINWLTMKPNKAHPTISAPNYPTASLTWTATESGFQASTVGERVYSYDASIDFNHSTNISTLAGPMTRTIPKGKWAYDTAAGLPLESANPGSWTWISHDRGIQYEYTYDASTKIWAPAGWTDVDPKPTVWYDVVQWHYDPVLLQWQNKAGTTTWITWTYNTTTKKWTAYHLGAPYSTAATLAEVWSFDYASGQWTNENTGEVWEHSYQYYWTLVSDRTNVFEIAPENGLFLSYGTSIGMANRSRYGFGQWQGRVFGSTSRNFYATGTVNERYNWYDISNDYPRGRYYRYDGGSTDGGLFWLYAGDQEWRLNGTRSTVKRFPPRFPPLVVLQHQDIIIAHDTANEQEALVSGPQPTATWTANGRSNEFGLTMPYDTAADPTTAPLKITTGDTELLHDLTHLPAYTALGKWRHTDSTNSHEWSFDANTGIWQNTTTGHQWQYSDINPSIWTDNYDGTFWGYNENLNAWTQEVHEQES